MTELTDAPQPPRRLLRPHGVDIGKIGRAETLSDMRGECRQLRLLFVVHAAAEEDDELRLRYRLQFIEREIGRELSRHAQAEQGEQPPQFLDIFAVHPPAVAEEHHGSFLAFGGLHKTIHECPCSIEIACIVLSIEKAVCRDCRDREPQFLLHLCRDRLCIVADHTADAGVCDKHRLRMIFLFGKANALPQTLLAAKDRLVLAKPARQERHRREPHRCARRRQPMKAAHVHPVRDVGAWTRTVKDDERTAHEGERTPDTGHAAAAVRAAHTDAFDLNPHSSPPVPRAPRTPSASARSAFHSYQSRARVPCSTAPALTPVRRR